jgi:hypothetical protein
MTTYTTLKSVEKLGKRRKSAHIRSVTRFCEDAAIEETDEIDMANFIVAASYLGVNADEDQLMEVFLEMEDTMEESGKPPKELIRDFVRMVEERYGALDDAVADPDDSDRDDEIIEDLNLGIFGDDVKWQDDQLGGVLAGAYQDQQLQVAFKLLDTTALSLEQIADITGVPATTLAEYVEEDDFSDEEDDDGLPMDEAMKAADASDGMTMSITVTGAKGKETADPVAPTDAELPAATISASALQKSLALTKADVALLDEVCAEGASVVKSRADDVTELLKKLKFAVEMTKTGKQKMKSAMRLRTMILSSSDMSKIAISAVEKEETKFPAKYRVVIHPGALVKEKETVKSAEVAKIKIGVEVVVEEIVGRRGRLSSPVVGWCSVQAGDGRTILQREGTRSPEMAKAVQEERGRRTKILILKSVTTLNDTTVERILEKSQWNLRRAIDAFYMTKYQTKAFVKKKEFVDKKKKADKAAAVAAGASETDEKTDVGEEDPKPERTPTASAAATPAAGAAKGSFWRSWKLFATQN